jgi:transcriptional regulator with XRE-family HTH domain
MQCVQRVRLGKNVRARRLDLGVSQETLADLAGLHRTYVGAVERGERNISLLNLIRLSKALRIPLETLVRDVA